MIVDPPAVNDAPAAKDKALISVLMEAEANWRLELAGSPPAFLPEAAVWALEKLHVACQFLVYRDIPEDVITAVLGEQGNFRPSPVVCYSVDICLRALPDVVTLARAASPEDALVTALLGVARRWPLSSVGVGDLGEVDLEPIWQDDSMHRLYVDRIIARADISRVRDNRVVNAVRAVLGDHHSLAPAIMKAIVPVTL